MQSTTFLHPLSQRILENPPLTHGDFNNYCFSWTAEEKQEVKKMYQYIRDITSKLLVNENRLTVRQSLEIGECPDIFLMDYFFLTYVRYSFVDFVALVFQSLSETSLFDGQMEQFEVTYEIPLEFYDWYTSFYPVESGKSMFYLKKQDTMVVKFFGTFAVKDEKLCITIPDFIMYSFVRLQFFRYVQGNRYNKIFKILKNHKNNLLNEMKKLDISVKNFIGDNSNREALIRTWYSNHITRYTDLEESFENLFEETDMSFENIFFNKDLKNSIASLELTFTFYLINFFLYSLVKDSPESFFDNFYQNYGIWFPDRDSFQQIVQMDIAVIYREIFGYELDFSDRKKWPFFATRKDSFFQWYHEYYFPQNPYTSNMAYRELIKQRYFELTKSYSEEEIYYKGSFSNWIPSKRFYFDDLLPTKPELEAYPPDYITFLSKFIQKGDILLFNYKHRFDPLLWQQPHYKEYSESPLEMAWNIIRTRGKTDRTRFLLLTTDLELSQSFLEAVSEDEF